MSENEMLEEKKPSGSGNPLERLNKKMKEMLRYL